MPDGTFSGRFGDLIDDSYDGMRTKSHHLTGGLGQLCDGIKGHENYKVNSGFEWIGWKAQNETLDIIFEFSEIRNFSNAILHVHNLFSQSAEVFGSAKAFFSFNGQKWSKYPVEYEHTPDHVNESPKEIAIQLNFKIGRFVKVSLKFASKWILLSEIKFNSLPVLGDYHENLADLESLEVAQEATEATHSNKRFELYFVIGLSLVSIVIGILTAMVLVKRCKKRYKNSRFYPIDVNYLNVSNKLNTPVYCEPEDRYGHEYAVPDVVYQNGLSSKRLIINPMDKVATIFKEPMEKIDINGQVVKPILSNHEDAFNQHINNLQTIEADHVYLLKTNVGLTQFGSISLARLLSNYYTKKKSKNLILLKHLENMEHRKTFMDEITEWTTTKDRCEHFVKIYGIIQDGVSTKAVIEFGDSDLCKFLKHISSDTIRLVIL